MDLEKTTRFILDMQAKREVAIQKHDEAMRQADQRFVGFREQTEERFRGLVDVTMSLARHGEETDRRFQEIAHHFEETNYKLNALIETVDKLVKHNGRG